MCTKNLIVNSCQQGFARLCYLQQAFDLVIFKSINVFWLK